jgi:hypothetical protein
MTDIEQEPVITWMPVCICFAANAVFYMGVVVLLGTVITYHS